MRASSYAQPMEVDEDVCVDLKTMSLGRDSFADPNSDHETSEDTLDDSKQRSSAIYTQPKSVESSITVMNRAQQAFHTPHRPEETLRKAALLPYILGGYVQLAFSMAIAGFWLYILLSLANTIFADIDTKVQLFSETVMNEIADCSRNYRENRCEPHTRVPAIASACTVWEACMARDPYVVARRTKIGVETIGESLNSFFEALTWKTIVSLVLLSCGLLVINNLAGCLGRGGVTRALDEPRYRSRTRKAAALAYHQN